MLPVISTDILGIIILIFILYLVKRNPMISSRVTKRFIFVILLSLVVTVLEILTLYSNESSSGFSRYVNIISNMAGFALTPFIPVSCAYLFYEPLSRKNLRIKIPIYIFVTMVVLSPWTKWIFYVTNENVYMRGPYFLVGSSMSVYSISIFMYAYYKKSKLYDKYDRIYLNMLCVILLFTSAVQVIYPQVLLIWCGVAIALLLYYIFLRELQFKYDQLTQVRNRVSYMRRTSELTKTSGYGVVVMDLNRLKKINDHMGHSKGDDYIRITANIIAESFEGKGIVYRIGGDEFCVIVEEKWVEDICSCLERMTNVNICDFDIPLSMGLEIAYGYAICEKNESYKECFQRADFKMYDNKMKMKKKIKELHKDKK